MVLCYRLNGVENCRHVRSHFSFGGVSYSMSLKNHHLQILRHRNLRVTCDEVVRLLLSISPHLSTNK